MTCILPSFSPGQAAILSPRLCRKKLVKIATNAFKYWPNFHRRYWMQYTIQRAFFYDLHEQL